MAVVAGQSAENLAQRDPEGIFSEEESLDTESLPTGDRKGRAKTRGPFNVNTVACTGKSSKDLFSCVAAELGWKEVDVEAKVGGISKPPKHATLYCVMNSGDAMDRLSMLGSHSWVSRYVGMPDLCDKGNFARIASACQDLGEPWDFNPKTWVLPEQLESLCKTLEKSKKTYIVKPEDGSQGDGIFLIQGLRDLEIKLSTKANKAAVVQRYIEKPLLLSGVKFDLRVYVCIFAGTATSPPLTYLCRDGLARFCTESYEEPTARNMHHCMAHLTNYSLNKRSMKFEHSGESLDEVFSLDSKASKRPMSAVLAQLEQEYNGFSQGHFFESVSALIQTTIGAMAPVLVAANRLQEKGAAGGLIRSFHILGYDVMLDQNFRPYLLEINNSPSLCIDEALPLDPSDPRIEEPKLRSGRPKETEGKVCLCMDMAQPHTHQIALVDLAVKKCVMCGAFQLLTQHQQGIACPEVESYIHVDVEGSQLFELMSRVEALYQSSGGATKAFTSSGLRRTFGPVCGKGKLEKHDLDTLSQKFRFTHYVAREKGRPDALRLYDFLDLIRQVGGRAFPDLEPLHVIEQVLSSVAVPS